MISAPLKIQGQLSDIVATIADNDFPHKWSNLIPVRLENDLVEFGLI